MYKYIKSNDFHVTSKIVEGYIDFDISMFCALYCINFQPVGHDHFGVI